MGVSPIPRDGLLFKAQLEITKVRDVLVDSGCRRHPYTLFYGRVKKKKHLYKRNRRFLSINVLENQDFPKHLYTLPAYNTRMAINQIIMGLGIVLGVYIMYKLFFNKIKVDDDYQKVYDKVLTSEEYKVKGQYNK